MYLLKDGQLSNPFAQKCSSDGPVWSFCGSFSTAKGTAGLPPKFIVVHGSNQIKTVNSPYTWLTSQKVGIWNNLTRTGKVNNSWIAWNFCWQWQANLHRDSLCRPLSRLIIEDITAQVIFSAKDTSTEVCSSTFSWIMLLHKTPAKRMCLSWEAHSNAVCLMTTFTCDWLQNGWVIFYLAFFEPASLKRKAAN